MTECAPFLMLAALGSVSAPSIIRMPPSPGATPSALSLSTSAVALQLADLLVVVRDREGDVGALDQAVVGDDGHVLRLRRRHDAGRCDSVVRVDDEHLDALGEHRLRLLQLLRRIRTRVRVQELALGAELLQRLGEVRLVLFFVPQGGDFGEQ